MPPPRSQNGEGVIQASSKAACSLQLFWIGAKLICKFKALKTLRKVESRGSPLSLKER
ncbi:hypothetical protein BM1374165_00307 [Bartonella henselae]|uniref:Uncharacterized protein n=1 Tax=Bartonella henselae TaxID=38323 RepID=X5MGD9_BARHN|nr:hypothetical protein BM1374165_00307 [Bartonella henselae]